MELQKKFIRTLIGAIAVTVFLSGCIFYIKSDIQTRALAIDSMRADIQARELSVAALARLQNDAERSGQYLPRLEQLRITRDQLLSFSSDINLLARQYGFSGTPKFKEDTTAPTGGVQRTGFSLALEGRRGLSDFAGFLEAIEQSAYYVRIEAITINKEGDILRATLDGLVSSFQQ